MDATFRFEVAFPSHDRASAAGSPLSRRHLGFYGLHATAAYWMEILRSGLVRVASRIGSVNGDLPQD